MDEFTHMNEITQMNEFTKINEFSQMKIFTQINEFNQMNDFTQMNQFTQMNKSIEMKSFVTPDSRTDGRKDISSPIVPRRSHRDWKMFPMIINTSTFILNRFLQLFEFWFQNLRFMAIFEAITVLLRSKTIFFGNLSSHMCLSFIYIHMFGEKTPYFGCFIRIGMHFRGHGL